MTSAAFPGGTGTFLFTDIEGSTRLEEAVGTAAYASLRERHRELLRAAFAAHGGIEQGTEGDSFFVVFPSPRGAAAAAIEAQRALAAEAWPADATIRVRMGLHSGEATLAGGSLVGLDINRAARVAAAANGGQVLISDATRVLVEADLPHGVALRDMGRHRLRDLREPERLHQLVIPGLPDAFAPIRTIDARPNNLPTQVTSFIGRAAELAEAHRLLDTTRLLTLTGPGGTGKTRLALQLAEQIAHRFPDGVFFVPLEPVRDPALVASHVLAAIGIPDGGSRPAREALIEWIRGKEILLVLDNFEQVADAAPLVADLIRSSERLTVIATSRAALRVSGEQEYPVPGLPAPPDPSAVPALERVRRGIPSGPVDPAAATQYEAVRLFIARAVSVRPDFQVTNENAPAVAAICARLAGMPLAIELAAARVKILGPDAILARLDHQLSVLASTARDLPERQQSLRGAIVWSYDLLDAGGRRLLDRLSAFAGGFDLDGAEAVCGPRGELGIEVLDGIESLVDQSLVRSEDVNGAPRFRLLDSIREFAAEMLEAGGQADQIRDRHRAWFLDLVKRAAPELSGDDQRAWLERLELEHANLRAVLQRAVEQADARTAIELAFAMWRFWQKRGHLNEARRLLEAIESAGWSRDDPRLRARLDETLGGICWWQGDLAAMAAHYREAVDLWTDLGDTAELANALYNYSFVFAVPADPTQPPEMTDPDGIGRDLLERALGLFREVGDRRGEANTFWALGNSHYFRAEPDAGIRYFRESERIFQEVGDRTMEAWALHMYGSGLLRTGGWAEAGEPLRRALRHFHGASDTAGITLLLDDLSSEAVYAGDLPRAARLRGAARNLTVTTGVGLAEFVNDSLEERFRASIRTVLDREQLEAWSREGAAMTLDALVAYALLPPERPDPSGRASPGGTPDSGARDQG
jgi:predicted ATPase/class 3 adenylate cyclase